MNVDMRSALSHRDPFGGKFLLTSRHLLLVILNPDIRDVAGHAPCEPGGQLLRAGDAVREQRMGPRRHRQSLCAGHSGGSDPCAA